MCNLSLFGKLKNIKAYRESQFHAVMVSLVLSIALTLQLPCDTGFPHVSCAQQNASSVLKSLGDHGPKEVPSFI